MLKGAKSNHNLLFTQFKTVQGYGDGTNDPSYSQFSLNKSKVPLEKFTKTEIDPT
jgi:hypothetical protein